MSEKYGDTKIVIIGFGFLMEYIYPCYAQFYGGEAIKTHVAAVTADEKGLGSKRERFPFPVALGENGRVLREMRPDVILFAPPPSVARELTEGVLKPYYDEQRASGGVLPDLCAFPPSPQGGYYLSVLGPDVQVCNILPNMVREIAGVSLEGREGATHITYPDGGAWRPEGRARIEAMFSKIGRVESVPQRHVLDVLATLAVTEVLPLALFEMEDALAAGGGGPAAGRLAGAMRAHNQAAWDCRPEGSTPCAVTDAEPGVSAAMGALAAAWNGGLLRFLDEVGVEPDAARRITAGNMDLKLHSAQLESRGEIEETLKNHATPGGVAERGRMCFELLMRRPLGMCFRAFDGRVPEGGYPWVSELTYRMSKVVALHGRRLSGDKCPTAYTPEHHAMLYAFFVREARAVLGEAAQAAVERGTLLYADQRGARMAKRAAARGLAPTMEHYMAFGEWAPLPGTMEMEDVSLTPCVVTHVKKCPWYDTWNAFGFLEEGAEYCRRIDANLVKGFNRELELGVDSVRPLGGRVCAFVWNGVCMDGETAGRIGRLKAELGESCRRDWLYHTRHVYSAMRQALLEVLGGEAAVARAGADFSALYGSDALREVEEGVGADYYEV